MRQARRSGEDIRVERESSSERALSSLSHYCPARSAVDWDLTSCVRVRLLATDARPGLPWFDASTSSVCPGIEPCLSVFAAAIQDWNPLENLTAWVAEGDLALSKSVTPYVRCGQGRCLCRRLFATNTCAGGSLREKAYSAFGGTSESDR